MYTVVAPSLIYDFIPRRRINGFSPRGAATNQLKCAIRRGPNAKTSSSSHRRRARLERLQGRDPRTARRSGPMQASRPLPTAVAALNANRAPASTRQATASCFDRERGCERCGNARTMIPAGMVERGERLGKSDPFNWTGIVPR
jgi:hypothetical protein